MGMVGDGNWRWAWLWSWSCSCHGCGGWASYLGGVWCNSGGIWLGYRREMLMDLVLLKSKH